MTSELVLHLPIPLSCKAKSERYRILLHDTCYTHPSISVWEFWLVEAIWKWSELLIIR